MAWPGAGINYGHQTSNNPYVLVTTAADFALLRALGVTKLRIAYPSFDGSNVSSVQVLVQQALNMGFYVIWGVSAGGQTVTATRWASFKSYVANTLAPWAQAQNNANLQLSVGNEEELHVDGTTVTATTVRSDIKGSYGASVKAAYTVGLISYETAATQQSAWASLGRGTNIDKLGFNVYYETDPNGTFKTSVNSIVTNFGSAGYVSEWSTAGGYPDLNSELGWSNNLVARQGILQTAGVDAFYFTFRDGGFAITADTFALMKANGVPRTALASLANLMIMTFG